MVKHLEHEQSHCSRRAFLSAALAAPVIVAGLPASEIGEVAAFARRSNKTWFLVVMNGPAPRSITIPLGFLGKGRREALLVRDRLENPAAVSIQRSTVTNANRLTIEMRAGGGFIGRFA